MIPPMTTQHITKREPYAVRRGIEKLKAEVSADLADGVLVGSVDRSDAAVVSQIYNVVLRAISTSLKAKEVEEMEARLGEMEKALERQGEGAGYGSAG